jgi:hydrogenase maturation factor HypF (carbamoyltransferase family)
MLGMLYFPPPSRLTKRNFLEDPLSKLPVWRPLNPLVQKAVVDLVPAFNTIEIAVSHQLAFSLSHIPVNHSFSHLLDLKQGNSLVVAASHSALSHFQSFVWQLREQ